MIINRFWFFLFKKFERMSYYCQGKALRFRTWSDVFKRKSVEVKGNRLFDNGLKDNETVGYMGVINLPVRDKEVRDSLCKGYHTPQHGVHVKRPNEDWVWEGPNTKYGHH